MASQQLIEPGSTAGVYPAPPPRWAVRAAHLAALTPVAASLWRLPLMFGISMGMPQDFMDSMMAHPFWQRAGYLIALGVISDFAAWLTLGLVRWWGEVFPQWIPIVGGCRVPPAVALVPAAAGGLAVCWLFTVGTVANAGEFATGWDAWTLLMAACYAPVVLWGPLVLLVTWSYYRRTRRP